MTNETASYTQKAELALEHRELLEELDNAVERVVEDMQASWDSEFLNDPPQGWTDEWQTVRYGGTYGRLLKRDWLHSSNTTGKPNKGRGFAIAFPTELLQTNVENGETFFKFKVYGGNEYSEEYQERFYADEFQDQIAPIINKYGLTIEESGDSSRLLKTPYAFEFDGGNGYQKALKQAFQEHLELVPHLEELYFEIRAEIDDQEDLA